MRSSIDVIIEFETCILNWLNIEQVITDSAEKIVHLLLILILSGNDNLLVKVVDTDDITDKGLQSSLKPVDPRSVSGDLNINIIVYVDTSHVTVEVWERILIANKLCIVSTEIIGLSSECITSWVLDSWVEIVQEDSKTLRAISGCWEEILYSETEVKGFKQIEVFIESVWIDQVVLLDIFGFELVLVNRLFDDWSGLLV